MRVRSRQFDGRGLRSWTSNLISWSVYITAIDYSDASAGLVLCHVRTTLGLTVGLCYVSTYQRKYCSSAVTRMF